MRACLGIVLAALGSAPAFSETPAHEARVIADALRRLDRPEPAARERAHEMLVALGSDAAPLLFAFFTGRGAEEVVLAGERPASPVFDEAVRELFLGVLRSWPAAEVSESLVSSLSADARLHERWVAVRLLGEIGDRRALPSLLTVLEPVSSTHLSSPFVHETLETALAGILARDSDSHRTLRDLVDSIRAAVFPAVVGALERRSDPASVFLLLDLLGREPGLDEVILMAIGEPRPRHEDALFGPCVGALRRHLAASDPSLARATAHGLGRWRDERSLASLIEMLDNADAGLLRVLRGALREISGIAVDQSEEEWREWWIGQKLWHEEQMPLELAELGTGDPSRVIGALRRLSEKRIWHREIAPEIAYLLRDESITTATSACAALERLADASVLPQLVELLDSTEPGLRSAAHRALLGISGVDLPADAAAWTGWLQRPQD